jgi:hypothetical protein
MAGVTALLFVAVTTLAAYVLSRIIPTSANNGASGYV